MGCSCHYCSYCICVNLKMAQPWSLTAEQRQDVVERVATNIFTMSFIKGLGVTDEEAHQTANAIEKKAYTAAEVAARTTTGNRPFAETTHGYARYIGFIWCSIA